MVYLFIYSPNNLALINKDLSSYKKMDCSKKQIEDFILTMDFIISRNKRFWFVNINKNHEHYYINFIFFSPYPNLAIVLDSERSQLSCKFFLLNYIKQQMQ